MSKQQSGVVHLALPLLILLLAGVVAFFVFKKGVNLPFNIPFLTKRPTVQLQAKYENPFNAKTQYVNPFDGFKNPFTTK